MSRTLAPYGSVGAVRRHQRAHEDLCDDCTVFWVQYRREHRGTSNDVDDQPAPDDDAPLVLPSPLDELRDHYKRVVDAMSSPRTPATALAALSSRREVLYRTLRAAENAAEQHRIVTDIADPDEAFDAVLAAGGTALDALLARSNARRKPLRTRTVDH